MAAKRKDAAPKATNIFYVLGSDDAKVKEAALALVRQHTPAAAGDFGVETIDGGAENSEHAGRICAQAIEAVQTIPFFGGGKVVWLKSVNFLADSVTGRAQATLEGIESLLDVLEAGLPADVFFVLSAGAVDKRRSGHLRLEKLAQTLVHDAPDAGQRGWEAQVEAIVSERSTALGLTFDPDALELFVLLAGERTQQIVNELEKLHLYLGPQRRRVTLNDVRTMVPLSRAGVVFELGNAIGQRDPRRAIQLLDQLLNQGENAVGILLAAIVPKMRNLVLARDMVERHRLGVGHYQSFLKQLENLPEAETAHLPRKKDGGLNAYPLFLAAGEGGRFTATELRTGLRACLRANHRLVSSSMEPRVVLSQLIVEILTNATARAA